MDTKNIQIMSSRKMNLRLGHHEAIETHLGLDWIVDERWGKYWRPGLPGRIYEVQQLSFLKECRCPGCGEDIKEIIRDGRVEVDTVISINPDKSLTYQVRPKEQRYCCGGCGYQFGFLTNDLELNTFIKSF